MRALYSAKIRSTSGKWAMLSPFKLDNGLPRSSFAQMNVFNLAIKDNAFDVVISIAREGALFDVIGRKKEAS